MRSWPVIALLSVGAILPAGARAHLGLDAPASRYGPEELKPGPCGLPNGERTQNVTYYEPGETIEVRWNEYVDHPGHYRIAFDADGDDDFVDPATMTDFYSNDAVLIDDIPDEYGGDYVVSVTLPDVTCENCTLQVIQVMYDKPPYTTPGNDIYYQCADLVLRAGGGPHAGPSADGGTDPGPRTGPGANDGGGGCSVARSDATGSEPLRWLLLLGACHLARRREFPV